MFPSLGKICQCFSLCKLRNVLVLLSDWGTCTQVAKYSGNHLYITFLNHSSAPCSAGVRPLIFNTFKHRCIATLLAINFHSFFNLLLAVLFFFSQFSFSFFHFYHIFIFMPLTEVIAVWTRRAYGVVLKNLVR